MQSFVMSYSLQKMQLVQRHFGSSGGCFFIYAVFRRDRMVRLMAVWVVIVPLPIAFLLPIRGGGCLYLLCSDGQ